MQTIASTPVSVGGAWGPDGSVLFTRGWVGPLYRVAAAGGEGTPVTRVDVPRQSGHVWPQFLPDGRHFLFYAFGTAEGTGIYLGSLDNPTTTRLTRAEAAGAFLPPDRVLFPREGALISQRLDVANPRLVGDPLAVAPHFIVEAIDAMAMMATSASGVIAYRSTAAAQQFTWFDRTGRQLGTLGPSDLEMRPERMPAM